MQSELLNEPLDNKMVINAEGIITFSNDFNKSYGMGPDSALSLIQLNDNPKGDVSIKSLYVSFYNKIPYSVKAYVTITNDVNINPLSFRLPKALFNTLKERLKLDFTNGDETLELGNYEKFELDNIGYKLTKAKN